MTDQTPQVRAIATQLIRHAIKQIDAETACDHIVATLGEDVDVDALAFGSESAVRKARIDISWDGAPAAPPLPPAVQSPVREQLLNAIDFSYCQSLGYATPEGLLAAYEASRTQTVDPAALRDRIACAIEDAAFCPGERRSLQLADVVLAVLPAPVDQAALVRACASFVGDTYSGEWADDAVATLETDADRIERGEPCSLLRHAAVLPATTNHDTDTSVTPPPALTEEGRLRARVQVLEEDAERDQGLAATGARCLLKGHQGQIESGHAVIEGHRIALSTKLGLGTGAPWDAIHERVAELRRVADETAATETQAECTASRSGDCLREAESETACDTEAGECVHGGQPAAWARQDEPVVTVHAVPMPGSNGISACCGRPPCEFVGERVTRDPDKVTCTGPAAGARQDGEV